MILCQKEMAFWWPKDCFFMLRGNLLWWSGISVITVGSHARFIALPTISQPALPARKQWWDFFLNILKFRKAFYATTAITSFQGKHRNLAYFLGHAFCNTLYVFLRQNHGDNSDNSCIYPFSHLQSTSPRWVAVLGTKEIAGKSEWGRIGVIGCSCASYFSSNNLWWYL